MIEFTVELTVQSRLNEFTLRNQTVAADHWAFPPDKIVQYAVREVLNCIYETDFVGFSYGFRRGRNAHQALDALAVGITDKRVNWVLDADIQGFFDAIDRDWLIKFLEHRIGDKRMLRLIRKWLNAGIIEDTNWSDSGYGTPQGSVISPLLANVFLH